MIQDTYEQGECVFVDTDLQAGRLGQTRNCAVGVVNRVVTQIANATGQSVTLKNFMYEILVICDPFRRFADVTTVNRFADEIRPCLPSQLETWQSLEPDSRVPLRANG